MEFENFIHSRREALRRCIDNQSKVDIVIGNESCDLDSAVCAVAYAYLLYNQRTTDQEIVPVLNVPRSDYNLKTEVVFLFAKHGIAESELVFIDDLNDVRKYFSYNIHLVDHNVLTDSQSEMERHVKTIVDHHNQDCTIADKEFVRIETVGSCASLVTDIFYKRLQSVKSEKLAHLLRATILVDSVCLREAAGKVKPLDIDMVQRLEQEFKMDCDSRRELFQQMKTAKSDITGFTTEQLLKKDSKVFTVSTTTVHMSTMPMAVQNFLSRGDVLSACYTVLLQQGARLLAIICNGGSDGVSEKHFLLYTKDNQLNAKLMQMVDCDPELQFTDTHGFSDYEQIVVRKFTNIKISRKQVLPKLKSFIQTITTGDDLVSKLRSDSDLTFNLELSAPGTPVIIDSPAAEPYSSQENSGSHTPNPIFFVDAPPNSYKDPTMLDSFPAFLPSFNSSEMVKRIMIKKNRLSTDHTDDSVHTDGSENNSGNNSCPFTPANSFADRYISEELHLPSFNSREMVHRMLQKKLPLLAGSGEISPADEIHTQQIFTPHNSECEGEMGSHPAFDELDLEHRLHRFEASDLYKAERRHVEDTAHAVVGNVLEQAMHTVTISKDQVESAP